MCPKYSDFNKTCLIRVLVLMIEKPVQISQIKLYLYLCLELEGTVISAYVLINLL